MSESTPPPKPKSDATSLVDSLWTNWKAKIAKKAEVTAAKKMKKLHDTLSAQPTKLTRVDLAQQLRDAQEKAGLRESIAEESARSKKKKSGADIMRDIENGE